MATRAPVKTVNKTPAQIASNAAAEKARKATSKAALNAVLPPKIKEAPQPKVKADSPAAIDAEAFARKRVQEAQNAVKSLTEDYNAPMATKEGYEQMETRNMGLHAYMAEQGFGPEGFPLAASAVATPGSYQGPMLALRTAAKSYVTGKNGNPHCNDWLANALADVSRETVVSALIAAMKLPGNPYLALNPGQQSMNLRNKARGMAKAGTLTEADLTTALQQFTK